MSWETAYLGCFLLGLTFVTLSILVGQFGGDAHGGHGGHAGHDAGGHHADGTHEGGIPLPLLSPTVLAIFVGMFGASGLILLRGLGVDLPLLHLPGALAGSTLSGLGVAWAMMKLMQHTEVNSLARHSDVVGREVEVTRSILGNEPGEIAYESGGTRHTLVAVGSGATRFTQGERVRVLDVMDGIAQVGPPAPLLADTGLESDSNIPVGTPVPRERPR